MATLEFSLQTASIHTIDSKLKKEQNCSWICLRWNFSWKIPKEHQQDRRHLFRHLTQMKIPLRRIRFFQKNTFVRKLIIFPNYFLISKKRLHSDNETTFLWNNIIWYAFYSISLLLLILKNFFSQKTIFFEKKPKISNVLRNHTFPVAFFGKLAD